jgi:hypothetical protein
MPRDPNAPKPTVPQLFARLEAALNARPIEELAKIGGEITFVVVDGDPIHWTVVREGDVVRILPRNSLWPVCRIGMQRKVLRWMLEGTLDVAKAFEERRLAVEGDHEALRRFAAWRRFAACFAPTDAPA